MRLRPGPPQPALIMFSKKSEIAAVGLEAHVEEIAENGNGPQKKIEHYVAEHERENMGRHAHSPRTHDDVEGREGRARVAYAGEKSEDRIQAEAYVGAGNAKAAVQPIGDAFEMTKLVLVRQPNVAQ